MLSAFLTLHVEKGQKKVNLLDIIFNFSGNRNLIKIDSVTLQKKYTLTYLYDFITQLTTFCKSKPELLLFVKENATKLDENGYTVIRRTQINKSQFKLLLDNFKVQRNFLPWISALYVMGCAKATMPTPKLNVISLDNFYKNNTTLAKAKIKQLFNAMGYVEKTDKNIVGNYSFSKDNKYCYFGVGFSKALEEQFFSEQKIKFNSAMEVDNILNSFNTQCTIPIVPENKTPIIPEDSKISDNVIPENMEEVKQMAEEQEDDQGAFEPIETSDEPDYIKFRKDNRPHYFLDLEKTNRNQPNPELLYKAIEFENMHPGYFSNQLDKAISDINSKELIQKIRVKLSKDGKFSFDKVMNDNYKNLVIKAKYNYGKIPEKDYPNWQQINDLARTEQSKFLSDICSILRKIADNYGDKFYWYAIWHLLAERKSFFTKF